MVSAGYDFAGTCQELRAGLVAGPANSDIGKSLLLYNPSVCNTRACTCWCAYGPDGTQREREIRREGGKSLLAYVKGVDPYLIYIDRATTIRSPEHISGWVNYPPAYVHLMELKHMKAVTTTLN